MRAVCRRKSDKTAFDTAGEGCPPSVQKAIIFCNDTGNAGDILCACKAAAEAAYMEAFNAGLSDSAAERAGFWAGEVVLRGRPFRAAKVGEAAADAVGELEGSDARAAAKTAAEDMIASLTIDATPAP